MCACQECYFSVHTTDLSLAWLLSLQIFRKHTKKFRYWCAKAQSKNIKISMLKHNMGNSTLRKFESVTRVIISFLCDLLNWCHEVKHLLIEKWINKIFQKSALSRGYHFTLDLAQSFLSWNASRKIRNNVQWKNTWVCISNYNIISKHKWRHGLICLRVWEIKSLVISRLVSRLI